jgi:hypothetical protein
MELFGLPVRQVAYYVKNVREAARRHSKLFGSGPFFAIDYAGISVLLRGRDSVFEHSTAIGQWGSVQVELMQENGTGPSILNDLYPRESGRYGIHHMAVFVDDLEDSVISFKNAGYGEAMRVVLPHAGLTVVFMDTVTTLGHFVELYEAVPAIANIYDMVAKAAVGFDRESPVLEATVDSHTLALHVKPR